MKPFDVHGPPRDIRREADRAAGRGRGLLGGAHSSRKCIVMLDFYVMVCYVMVYAFAIVSAQYFTMNHATFLL